MPDESSFMLDYDGQGNKNTPAALAAEAEREGNANEDIDTVSDEEFDSLLSGGIDNEEDEEAGADEEGEKTANSSKSTGEDFNTQLTNAPVIRQIAAAVATLAQGRQEGSTGAEGNTAETQESVEDAVKAELRQENPDLDASGIDWLYKVGADKAKHFLKPLQEQVDRLEKSGQGVAIESQVKVFYDVLDKQLDTELPAPAGEGVTDEDKQAAEATRHLVKKSVVAEFHANKDLTMNHLPAVVKEVKGQFIKAQHVTDESRRKRLKKRKEETPVPAGKNGQVGFKNMLSKAINSKRSQFDFGQEASSAIVREIVRRTTLNA
mgnify:CR=1 FL=1